MRGRRLTPPLPVVAKTMTRITVLSVTLALAVAPMAFVSPSRADEAACKAVFDAVVKQSALPVRQKMTIETDGAPGRRLESEMVHMGDKLYMQINGHWITRPYDARKVTEDARKAMASPDHSCTRVGSESVDGKPADLYSVKSKADNGITTESQIWIAKDRGVPLRQKTVMMPPGKPKMQNEVSFAYDNVTAPAGAK